MMPAIAILAGGYATRLYPVTRKIPKSMLPVAGKPFIEHQLALLKKNNISRVVLCCGYLSEQIQDFVGDGEKFGLSVWYSFDGKTLLGTGGAIKKALPLLSDVFFVMYGDSYLDVDFKSISDYFQFRKMQGLMTVMKNDDQWDKSNVVFRDGRIVAYDKKEKTRDMEYIDYGLNMLKKSAFDEIAGEEAFDLAALFQKLIAKEQMTGFEIHKRFYEIGSAQGLIETENYIFKMPQNKENTDEQR
jgi:N-acetyl-alpha-D-muramate 1-phosphate uridylyltransferase